MILNCRLMLMRLQFVTVNRIRQEFTPFEHEKKSAYKDSSDSSDVN